MRTSGTPRPDGRADRDVEKIVPLDAADLDRTLGILARGPDDLREQRPSAVRSGPEREGCQQQKNGDEVDA